MRVAEPMPLLPDAPPRSPLPKGATDCHMHIYGDPERYPVNAASPFKPVAEGTVESYKRLMTVLGLTRTVVVQPSAYGTDNSCTLDAMAELGAEARGVAVVDESATDEELQRLTGLGVRGLRYFMLSGGVLSWESLPRLAARVAEHGWHVQLQMDGRLLPDRMSVLTKLSCHLVIDHNGKFLEPVEVNHPGVSALRRLIDAGRTHVKTSGVYETSREGAPSYEDVAVLARMLIKHYPERCLWATNWPHPSKPNDLPDDSHLADLFTEWCGSEAVRARILVGNPAELYGFSAV